MFLRLLFVAALFIGVSPLGAQNKDIPSPGNPPTMLIASQINGNGNLVLVEYRTIFLQPASPTAPGGPRYNSRSESEVSLKGVKICNKNGKQLSLETARSQIANKETAVLATGFGQEVSPTFRALFRDDILVFVFPDEAPRWKEIQAADLPVRD
jgi:hypothetical protein